MNNRLLILASGLTLMASAVQANHFILSTPHTSLVISADKGGRPVYQYYGPRISTDELDGLFAARANFNEETYPAFGLESYSEKALAVKMPDGNMSVDLAVQSVTQTNEQDGELLTITMRDKVYPFIVKQYFKAYSGTDVITTWTDLINEGKKSIQLLRFASAFLPLRRGNNYVSHFHGTWAAENMLDENAVPNGQMIIGNKEGLRNSQTDNPAVMVTLDGRPEEESGQVFGCDLAWSGNFRIQLMATKTSLEVAAGINEETSDYGLQPRETFSTPELAMTWSTEGKGGVSRAFHRWALKYKLQHADQPRSILLNSWEGVYFGVNQEVMDQMMKDFSALGGELFVMDDGWFGNKYPRDNDHTSLGDWDVCRKKLPQGIEGLLASAKKYGIHFGIWIEPEMANTKSELFEKHPEWVLSQTNRPLTQGRGGTQVVLDLCNPQVQDFVFGVVDNLLTRYPEIAYIKWDTNAPLMNYGSRYLAADKQSEIYIRYHIGLQKVLKRIRAKFPNVVMQACASGGGRINYGLLPYFDEFWTSDDTDAYQRLLIQWGVSHFYPAIGMAAHVSASPNHQTGRITPIKFRFDVAMTGRLGMEIQPSKMTDADKDFARRAIADYKSIQPLVQQGDLYRLISPYAGGSVSALMYANQDLSQAVLFAYRIKYLMYDGVPMIKLSGIDENKTYRITELDAADPNRPCYLNGTTVSGKLLKYTGLNVEDILDRDLKSVVLKLDAVH